MRISKIVSFMAPCILITIMLSGAGLIRNAALADTVDRSGIFNELEGPYLGQPPPGRTPVIFAPGIISHGYHEHNITFSDDGLEAFYVMSDNYYLHHFIIHLTSEQGRWNYPEVASFCSEYTDMGPFFSPDNNRLYFTSKRPYFDDAAVDGELNIWYSDRTEKGWTEARKLPGPINTTKKEGQVKMAANKNLYFQALYESSWDIYMSVFDNGTYLPPQKLPDVINTDKTEAAPFISPDEKYLLFHSDRDGGFGYNDLYISFRLEDGSWGEPSNLGPQVNSMFSEFNPVVSPDGKYLFYSSYNINNPSGYANLSYAELIELYQNPRNGYATLYWVSADILADFKPDK